MKDIELEAFAGEVNKFVSERLEPVSEKVSELTERLDDIAKQPAPVNGKDGKDGADGAKGDTGEKGADGLGLDIPAYAGGVYREGSIVQANFGQAFRALVDTAKGVDSEDWERIGTHGFRLTGPYSADKTYQPGDLFIKDFGLFLHDGNEAKLIAGRGPEGKKGKQGPAGKDGVDGQDGADGKDGSQIEAMEIKGTSLVLVVKDADGEVKSFDTDLAPFLDAAVEVTKSLTEDTTKAQAAEVEAQVKNLWTHLNEHLTDQQAVPVRFYRGLWSPSVAYQAGDMVTYSSGQYLCRQSNTGVMPFGQLARDINSGDYWVQFSSGSGGGTGEAGDMPTRITTDMVKTNPSVTFRDSKGRFKTKVDVSGLTDQLKVNRFIADELDALVVSDSDLQKQIDELAEYHKEPAPEPTREPIYAEDEPTEYPHAKDGESTDLQVDDQWYEVTDPDFDYDNPNPEGLDLYIWTQVGNDFEWVLFVEVVEYVSKTGGDKMEGPLDIDGGRSPDANGIVSTIKVLNVDSGENSDLQLRADGSTRVYVGKTNTTLNGNLKFSTDGAKIVTPNDEDIIQINGSGAFYDGNISVERHLVNKEYVDTADQHLHTLIDELEQEIDIIAPRLEGASYTYSASPAVKAGEMHVMSGSFTAGTDVILFNDVALDGKTHTWAELQVGDYLEITDTLETRTAANYAMYLVSKAPEGTGLKQIDVTLVKGQGAPTAGDVMDAKGFQLGGNDINDLDARYAGKEAERLNISHQAENTAWYNAPHKLGIVRGNIQVEQWYSSYERLKHDGQEGLLAFTSRNPTSSGTLTPKSWSELTEGSDFYLRNTDSRLDNTALKKLANEDVGSVIVMRQPSTGAELSLHVKGAYEKTWNNITEHGASVRIRRRRGSPTEDGEWRVYLQKEYLSAKGHDHYVGRLNTRENRTLVKWKSLASSEFSLSEATGTPSEGNGCYSWNRGRWFKIYSGQFAGSVISGDYNNGLGIVTVQQGNTIYCGYLTVSEAANYNGDHTWRTQSFMGQYETSPITEWDQTFTVATNGLIQNSRTQYTEKAWTNVYTVGSPDEDIENPERPVWTGDNFGDFKNLNDFVAELKSADPTGSSIEFLMEQWQTYWYTPGR